MAPFKVRGPSGGARRHRSTYKKKSSYKRRRTYKRRGGGGLAAKVAKLTRTVGDMNPRRLCFSDDGVPHAVTLFNGTTGLNSATPFLKYINLMTISATAPNTRGTNIFHVSKISLKVMCKFEAALTGSAKLMWMLVYDKECKGSAMTAAGFGLDYFGVTTPYSASIRNQQNSEQAGKYKVLKKGYVYQQQNVLNEELIRNFSINWSAKEHLKVNASLGSGGTIADIDTGGIFIFVYVDGNAGDTGGAFTGYKLFTEGNMWFRDGH
nr:MAG: capsid protein [Cressdnaviricota sp.]